MDEDWEPVLAHESGHALMSFLQGVPCHGIGFERGIDGGRFCALLAAPSEERSSRDYLISAAGVAAERLIYPNQDSDGAEADRADFHSLQAPPFEETVWEAQVTLASEMKKLEKLIAALNAKLQNVDSDFSPLPEAGMEGSSARYFILLSEDELNDVLNL